MFRVQRWRNKIIMIERTKWNGKFQFESFEKFLQLNLFDPCLSLCCLPAGLIILWRVRPSNWMNELSTIKWNDLCWFEMEATQFDAYLSMPVIGSCQRLWLKILNSKIIWWKLSSQSHCISILFHWCLMSLIHMALQLLIKHLQIYVNAE